MNEFRHPDDHDELDALLRRWHEANAQRAAAGRAALMARLAQPRLSEPGARSTTTSQEPAVSLEIKPRNGDRSEGRRTLGPAPAWRGRYLRAAASLALLLVLAALLVPHSHSPALAAQQEILVPDGGRLDAVDERGNLIGPCALKHTDVEVAITGPFTRVTIRQDYHNPYQSKIEAVYTFPLSHRAAVDRMSMTIGDRVVEGEVKERQQARQMYESARNAGYVASLLEQERPNIFTQSVANIEAGAQIAIEISYIEMLESIDGVRQFDFPMVVAPRYIPGYSSAKVARLPAELKARRGVILRGPAQLTVGQAGATTNLDSLQPAKLQTLLASSQPIEYPGANGESWWGSSPNAKLPEIWCSFEAAYADGSKEIGFIFTDGTGQINNRWFYCEPASIRDLGTGYEPDTDQVPDASRITPMPVRPPTRAGHDVSLSVSIDTGGPAVVDYTSDLHEIICTDPPTYKNLGNRINLALKSQREIPNRDFVLRWRTMDDRIQEATFVHAPRKPVDDKGDFFTLIVAPPARVNPDDVPSRELIFVLDTSGSMSGQPIEKAKAVMAKAIDSMRDRDTFNIITFSGDTHILWDRPRSNTEANRAEAQAFLASRSGGGGTEMMAAINAALSRTPILQTRGMSLEQLANLPADGRAVAVAVMYGAAKESPEGQGLFEWGLPGRNDVTIRSTSWERFDQPGRGCPMGAIITLLGRWATINGERLLQVESAHWDGAPLPMRIVMFLTDGLVGNDHAIIQAVKDNAKTTRVFSFGVGDSPNRSLLQGIASAGRGEVEFVNLQSDPDQAVDRFVKRVATPVLADIALEFAGLPEGVQITDTVPPLDAIPDLFDVKPVIVHGRIKQPLPLGEGRVRDETPGHGEPTPSPQPSPSEREREPVTLAIRGTTGAGAYERTIPLDLKPKQDEDRSLIATLWARASVEELMKTDLNAVQQGAPSPQVHKQVVALGERFNIVTQYTSFVAIEKARLTVGGRSVLVPVPIELPHGMEWEGVFGEDCDARAEELGERNDRVNTALLDVRQAQMEGRYPAGATRVGQVAFYHYRPDAGQWNVGYFDQPQQPGNTPMQPGVTPSTGMPGFVVLPQLKNAPQLDLAFALAPNTYVPSQVNVVAGAPGVATAGPVGGGGGGGFGGGGGGGGGADEKVFAFAAEFPWQRGESAAGGEDAVRRGSSLFTGGGSLFSGGGEPDRPWHLTPIEDQRLQVAGIVREMIHPADWTEHGGALAELEVHDNVFTFKPAVDSPEARAVIDKARAFLAYLQATVPGVGNLGVIDAQPSRPFEAAAENVRTYDVRDLIGWTKGFEFGSPSAPTEEEAAQQVVDVVTELIDPAGWTMMGGDTSDLWFLAGHLIVRTPNDRHDAIELLLKAIRQVMPAQPSAAAQSMPVQFNIEPPDAAVKAQGGPPPVTRIVVYDARPLIASMHDPSPVDHDEAIEQLVNILQENIDPENWRDLGGDMSTLLELGGCFIIATTELNHRSIGGLLRQLAHVNGLPANGPETPEAAPLSDDRIAAKQREALVAEAKLLTRLRRVVDQRLWDPSPQPLPFCGFESNGGRTLMIAVLVHSLDAQAISELKRAGMNIEDTAPHTDVAGGTIARSKLVALAMLENVRRIEPIGAE